MATDLVEINPEDPQPEVLERAAAAVRRGKVVAIPTDALYTLVADPFNLGAVTGVYRAKGRRPLDGGLRVMPPPLTPETTNSRPAPGPTCLFLS